MTYDCIVVGSGLAGLTAALRISEGGLRCVVVAKGVGSLHLGGATIDFLGYLDKPVKSPREGIEALRQARPGHPYARVAADQLDTSVDWLKSVAGDLTGDLSANLLIPTALGVPKPTAVVPNSIRGGDMSAGGAVALVGFTALKDFYPLLAADNLERSAPGISARGIELDVAPNREPDINPLRYARALDDVEFRKNLISAVEGQLDGADRVGFPAILGVRDANTAWAEIQDALGVEVFEIPTLPPSIPGIRLFDKLRTALRSADGRMVLNNTVVGARAAESRVTELVVDNGSRTVELSTRAVVLATGGVAAGGIAMNSAWEVFESALGLPVAGVPSPEEKRFDPDFFAEQPLDGAGVATDDRLRPVDDSGNPVYDNVFVAGATLTGAMPWREASGNGISLATGWSAGRRVIEEIG